MLTRILIAAAFALLGVAPAAVCGGVWLQFGAGWGIAAGGIGSGLLGGFLLTADLLPDPPREATR